MAWGDHTRVENKIDEQQKMAQGYLTGTQQNIGNQYGANNSLYWGGGGAPSYGQTYGFGSTVPNYSQYGRSPFQGNGTDTLSQTPTGTPWNPNSGFSGYPSGGSQIGGQGGGDPKSTFMTYAQSLGGATPENLHKAAMYMQQQGFDVREKPGADGFVINGVPVDMISNFKGGNAGNMGWQFLPDSPMGGGGSSIGQYGAGGIPGMALNDYGGIMGAYGGYLGSAQNMAETGGLSEGDKANLRARAISPIRSVYSQGLQNVNRQRALQGGYSPGYGTLMGRFNREQGQATSDATTNAEAAIAELAQRGKIAGLGAWNQGLGGMSQLYGTQPGMAKFFGDQLQNSMENQLKASGLQNELSLGTMGQTNYMGSKVQGNLDSALDTINKGRGAASAVGGVLNSLPGTNSRLDPRNWDKPGNGEFRPYNPQTDNPPVYGDPNYVQGQGIDWSNYGNPPSIQFGGDSYVPSNQYNGTPNYYNTPDLSGGSVPVYQPNIQMPYDPNNPQYQL